MFTKVQPTKISLHLIYGQLTGLFGHLYRFQ